MGVFGPYEPDRAIFNPGASTYVRNVIPVADGYGPMPEILAYSQALPGRCYGACYIRSSTGSFTVIAGTQTALYRLNPSTLAWTDISGPDAPYDVPDSDRWSFARYGTKLFATTVASPLQEYDVDAPTTFTTVAGSPPQAKYVTVAGDFLMLGHIQHLPQRVQWSGVNDSSYWTSGDRGSDFQDFPDGEDITGIFGDSDGVVVVQRHMFRIGTFDPGSGFVFRFSVVNPSNGSPAPLSIVQIGPRDFIYVREDGFARGIAGTPIGAERVDRTFLKEISHDEIPVVRGVADPFKKIAWFSYTSGGTPTLLGYNWQLDQWTRADNNVTEMLQAVSVGYTLDAMDAFGPLDAMFTFGSESVGSVTPGYSFGILPMIFTRTQGIASLVTTTGDPLSQIPLDSRFWKGGAPTFAAFDNDDRLCFFSGNNREATIATADEQPIPGSRSFVSPKGIRLLADTNTATMVVTTSDYPGGTRTAGSALSPSSVTGLFDCSKSGLLFSSKVTIPAGTTWKNAIGIDYNAIPEGQR